MALMNDMETYQLQKLNEVEMLSGQKRKEWIDVEKIEVAVYLNNEMAIVGNVKYEQYDCVGLTFYTKFDKKNKYRITNDDIYTVLSAVKNGVTMHLLLKRIEV